MLQLLSMPGMAVCLLLLSFATRSVEAWLSIGFIGNKSDGKVNHRHYNLLPINIESNIDINFDIIKTSRKRGVQSSTITSTQLSFIKWKDKTDEEDTEPSIQLSSEQDQILRDVTTKMEESDGIGWFEQSDAWDELKVEYPTLQEYTNEELTKAFILQKPTVIEVFTKTPLGPILLVNAIFKLGGFSWCDTPFGSADACL